MLRVWLAGSRSFGALVLSSLRKIPHVEVVAITAPASEQDALFRAAQEVHGFVHAAVLPDAVQRLNVDLIVSAQNYSRILRQAREAALIGAIGYHPSLLPRHRGRSSVEWTIAMGDPIAGGTVYLMDDGWDTGPIIKQDFCHVIPGWDASDLWREALFPMGIRLLTEVVEMAAGRMLYKRPLPLWPQDERCATTEPRWEQAHVG